jgi:tRNA pseudouridine55 synthase
VSARRTEAHGVLVVDKPSGPTSHDVVQVARRTVGPRVGHTGTLDPLATGVLPLVVGRATRLAQFMTGADKTYEATLVFGRETDTYDAAGETTAESGQVPPPEAIAALVAALPGRRLQTPPIYSAKKIGGEAAHRLARRDAAVVPAAVDVEVFEASLLAIDGREARVRVRVSAGFYVRSLAHDAGRQLGTGAHLGALRRLRSGVFGLEDAVPWVVVATGGPALLAAVVPPERLLTHFPAAHLDAAAAERARNGGQVVALVDGAGGALAGPVRLFDPEGRLAGLAMPATAPGPHGTPGAGLEGGSDGGSPGLRSMRLQPTVILG